MKRKINQMTKNVVTTKESAFYERNRKQYEFLLNPDPGIRERGEFYIPDEDIHSALRQLLAEPMDSTVVLIGNPGIGKTSDIRACFQVQNSVPRLYYETKTIILFCAFEGYFPQMKDAQIDLEFAKRVASVCTDIENDLPSVKEHFYSMRGQRDFLQFIQKTNPKSLETNRMRKSDDVQEKLQTVMENEYFIYIASKLKFYLSMLDVKYERILIIVDNIEAQKETIQNQIVLEFLKLFSCLRNFPSDWKGKRVYVNMLLSVRPDTYRWLKKLPAVSSRFMREIYKQKHIDLGQYFRKKASLQLECKKVESEKWKDAENALFSLCEKFESKYSNMIMGLANNDIRQAMKILERVLSNPVWVTKEACTDRSANDYIINNITVIRAIACGKSLVYFNNEDQLIPNVFFNTVAEDNSIISLYIIAYFKEQNASFLEYGKKNVFRADLLRDFCDIFVEVANLEKRVDHTIDYLYAHKILSLGIPMDNRNTGIDTEEKPSCLVLSPLGMEIWNMLAADSVLLELYREDYYQEYHQEEMYRFKSSYELMREDSQETLFIELYRILLDLLSNEEIPLINAVKKCGSIEKYTSLFGAETMIAHLMAGVDCSVEFSGKNGNADIQESRSILLGNLSNIFLNNK